MEILGRNVQTSTLVGTGRGVFSVGKVGEVQTITGYVRESVGSYS